MKPINEILRKIKRSHFYEHMITCEDYVSMYTCKFDLELNDIVIKNIEHLIFNEYSDRITVKDFETDNTIAIIDCECLNVDDVYIE